MTQHSRSIVATFLVAVAVVLVGCSGGVGPSAAPSTAAPESSGAFATPGPSAVSPAPSFAASGPVTGADDAAHRVLVAHPEFGRLGPRDPNLIGQCCWYVASRTPSGYRVDIVVGSGDCQAGCIDRHRWTFEVSPDGSVTPIGESGPPLPSGVLPGI